MAEPVPAGSDVSAGTYKCTNCGYELQTGSTGTCHPARAATTDSGQRSPEATARTIRTRVGHNRSPNAWLGRLGPASRTATAAPGDPRRGSASKTARSTPVEDAVSPTRIYPFIGA